MCVSANNLCSSLKLFPPPPLSLSFFLSPSHASSTLAARTGAMQHSLCSKEKSKKIEKEYNQKPLPPHEQAASRITHPMGRLLEWNSAITRATSGSTVKAALSAAKVHRFLAAPKPPGKIRASWCRTLSCESFLMLPGGGGGAGGDERKDS